MSVSYNISEKTKYKVISIYAIIVLISSFFFNTPTDILIGLKEIIIHPSVLITDYMEIGNIGAALFNSGMLMIVSIIIAKLNKVKMFGSTIAAIFIIGGFALFGKNLYNIWPIFIGVYIYSRIQREKFNKYILIAFFGTALGPLISIISFGYGSSIPIGLTLGTLVGILAGLFLPPLSNHLLKFHQGFSLYNVGFAAGMLGTLFMSVFRAYGITHETSIIVTQGNNLVFAASLFLLFLSMLFIGLLFNGKSISGYGKLLKRSGRAVTDFVVLDGFGIALINMGLNGLITTTFVLIVGGELNGPSIGAIITVVGFSAFGKHPKNIIPVMLGVVLASLTQVWELNSISVILATLFGTTLAPIAGEFGWKGGILAGFLHMTMVMNVGYLHGGLNLYNNGFSGGMVAGILVPIIDSLRKDD